MIQTDPLTPDEHIELARIYAKQAEWQLAERHYLNALKGREDSFELWFELGYVYAEEQKVDDAIKAYKKAIELKPDLADAWNNLAEIHLKQGKLELAYKEIENALKNNEENISFYMLTKAKILFAQGKNEEAVDLLEQALKMIPEEEEELRLEAETLLKDIKH